MATVDKAFAVLSVLVDEGDATIQSIADRLGAPRSSVYRLVASLQRLGAVEPGTGRGTYRLGLELLRLGSAVTARFDERQAALDTMERLHQETEETIFLCVRDGYRAVCIERIDGRWVRSMGLPLGGSLPLHVGASPRTLLAFSPRWLWDEYIENCSLDSRTSQTPQSAVDLRDSLEEARRLGYTISDGDVVIGMAAVGAPIYDFHGKLRAALSMSGPQASLLGENREASIARITEAAAAVSRALGAVASTRNLRDD